jgi:uncharacterized protein (TIGR02265 family)
MAEKLIFSQTFEGLFRAAGSLSSEDPVLGALVEAGIDPRRPLRPAYPLSTFHQTLSILGQALAPGLPPDEQARQLGRRFIDGYGELMVGRAMLMVMRVLGPFRTLERLSRQFRTGNNFSETRLTSVSPRAAELWCNQVTLPGWYRGILERGLECAGAEAVQISVGLIDETGGTFSIAWR